METSAHNDLLVESEEDAQFRRLTELNADDLLTAFGLTDVGRARPLLHWLCHRPAARFARDVMAYDSAVGHGGLGAGGRTMLPRWTRSVRFEGQEHVPPDGPVLIVSNHPGLTDTLALFAALPRSDVRIIAAERVFLHALANTRQFLLLADDTAARRLAVVRAAARHLREGSTILTFPAGRIEPDPALFDGALDSLEQWRGHIGIFPRIVPDLTIVPVIVAGVVAPASLRNPLLRLRRQQRDRDWLAATLQVLLRRYQQVDVTVTFGHPIHPAAYPDGHALTEAVLVEARRIVRARRRPR